MNNLGKANIKVEVLDTLPNVDKDAVRFNFDITAHQWESIQKSQYFPPLLAEQVASSDDSFAAIFPAKRKHYIDNFISDNGAVAVSGSFTGPYIAWTPTVSVKGIVADIFSPVVTNENPSPYNTYILEPPRQEYSPNYNGPKWSDAVVGMLAPTNDWQTISNWYKWRRQNPNNSGTTTTPTTTTVTLPPTVNLNCVNQQVASDGLWWGIQSNEFIEENMPLWINLHITRTPATANHETLFVISLGLDDEEQAFDIKISHNNKPIICDYYLGRNNVNSSVSSGSSSATTGNNIGAPVRIQEFDVDISRFLDDQQVLEIGIMTIAGRLVVWFNKVNIIYTRVDQTGGDNAGKIKECKIGKGKMAIYGTNVQAIINVCPMTFAPFAALALPLPTTINSTTSTPVRVNYEGVDNKGNISGSVAILPQQPDRNGKLFGVDCYSFYDATGVIYPYGFGFHKQGTISFTTAGSSGINVLPDTDFYVLTFVSDSIEFTNPMGQVLTLLNAGCPYFFRLKGAYNVPRALGSPVVTVVPEVLSATETMTASDYFNASANASVTIYNKNGKYDYLRDKQYGVKIYWGWEYYSEDGSLVNNIKQTFTGLITGVTTSETPGNETLTLQCEDYMYILKNTPIINSPFYDGMVAYYAIADLAKRAGITSFYNDMTDPNDYFLPSGYVFSSPAMRYPSQNKIYDCIIDMVKRFEAFIVFDATGSLHIHSLPGGLFSTITGVTVFAAEFTRNPDAADTSRIILNEKNVEYSFASTVNKINILSLDRDTRNYIVYNRSARFGEDHLVSKKILMIDQAAYGDLEVVRTYAERLAKRVFWPIRKTNFSTVGSSPLTTPGILEFVKVDGQEYRVLSIAKKYNSQNNDYTVDYSTEWLGGR